MVQLRKTLLLPLDDLLAVAREFLCPDVSRSGLDRCLRRHDVGNPRLCCPSSPRSQPRGFKPYEPGYVHLYNHELPQSALHSKTPVQAMRDWYNRKPVLFNKNPPASTTGKSASNRPGCDN